MSDPFRDRSEILDGPPSVRDRVVEQAEYIRLLEEKLAEAKNRHAEHLAAHRTADAHDCAEMEEMYQREKAKVERLREAIRPIAAAIVDAGPRLPDDKSVELTLSPKEADRIVKAAGMESNRVVLRGEGEK